MSSFLTILQNSLGGDALCRQGDAYIFPKLCSQGVYDHCSLQTDASCIWASFSTITSMVTDALNIYWGLSAMHLLWKYTCCIWVMRPLWAGGTVRWSHTCNIWHITMYIQSSWWYPLCLHPVFFANKLNMIFICITSYN